MADIEKFDTCIVSCSDPRVTPTLEALQTLDEHGRTLMIRVPGGLLNRSIIEEVIESGAKTVFILDHTDCAAHKNIYEEIGNAENGSLAAKVRRALESRGLMEGINGGKELAAKIEELHIKSLEEEFERKLQEVADPRRVRTSTINVTGLSTNPVKALIISDDPSKTSAQIIRETGVDVGSAYIIKAKEIKGGYVTLLREVTKNKETGEPAREIWLVQRESNLKLRVKLALDGTGRHIIGALRAESGAAVGERRKITK